MNAQLPQNAQEYIDLVRRLGAMVDAALEKVRTTEYVSDHDKQGVLARVAEAVETISSLRGDSGLFDEFRPEGLIEYQKEMYTIENVVRAKLLDLGYEYPKR